MAKKENAAEEKKAEKAVETVVVPRLEAKLGDVYGVVKSPRGLSLDNKQ